MQHFSLDTGQTEHTFAQPAAPITTDDSAVRGNHKHSDSYASQASSNFGDPFHSRTDSTSSLARSGQLGVSDRHGFEGIPVGTSGTEARFEQETAHFFGEGGGLWKLNTSELVREDLGSTLTSPVSTIATNAESTAGAEAYQPSADTQTSADIQQYLRQAQEHFQQAQHLEKIRQAHHAQQAAQVVQHLSEQQQQYQQQTRGRSVSQPSHFAEHRFSFPLDLPVDPTANIMNTSPARPSVDNSNNVSPEHPQNIGSSPSQGLENAYFPMNGLPAGPADHYGMGAQMSQPAGHSVEQQMAMMNAMKNIQVQLPPDARIPISQPVSPVAHRANNGAAPFSTPAGVPTQQSQQPHPVYTRPRGMTVGTVPVMPPQLAAGYQHAFTSTPVRNGNMHGTPEGMFAVNKHMPHTQGPSPVAVSPFNVQPSQASIPHTAPPSPGAHMATQEVDHNMFMNPVNPVLTTPQRTTTANGNHQEAPRSLPEFNPVPTLENQAMAFGLGMNEIRMSLPMSLSNSQASFHPPTQAAGSAGSGEDGAANRSLIGSRRSSTAGGGQGMGGMMQMKATMSSQGNTSSDGQNLSQVPPLTVTTDSSQIEALSHELRDKLTFLTNLQNKLTAAINEAQLNHPMAVDEYLNDIKKAIVNKENEPKTPSTAASAPGQMSAFNTAVHRQASPLSMGQTINNRMESVTPINVSLGAANSSGSNAHEVLSGAMVPNTGGLLAPVELSRAASSAKRAAPESPMSEGDAASQNKHIRLEQETDGIDRAVSQAGPSHPMAPPQLVHAHSYPQAGGASQPMMAVPMNAVPTLAGAAMPQLIPQTHIPANPSPLSHVSNAPQTMPYAFGHPTGIPVSMDPSMQNWPPQHVMLDAKYAVSTMVPIQQPTALGRRGSIVDGRLIAPRPRVGDTRSITTGAIPTLNSLGMTAIASSQPMIPLNQATGMDTDNAVDDGDLEDDLDDSDDDDGPLKRRPSKRRRSSDPTSTAPDTALIQPPDLISDEIRLQLDKIMYGFLNHVCSDLNATDAKGELIHQPLMKKKMDRLDASTDFRPFKFRIQAFTNAFSELLQRKGILEETLPAKKIKSYLWNQKLISRFNDDGKKSKSKGNHIWNVDAKKLPDGQWIFRPFQRKIHLPEPLHAWYGAKFAWQPKVWDPQASTSNLKVDWKFEGLPSWLEFKEDVKGLEGIPMEGDSSADITVTALFRDANGKELSVSTRFFLPVGHLETSNSASNTTPAGLMLSAMNGSDHTHTSLGEIKQEDAMRMVDSPLRDVNEHNDSMTSSFHSQLSGMDHELPLDINHPMVHMDPSMFDNVSFEHMIVGDPPLLGNSIFQHPPTSRGPDISERVLPQSQPPQLTANHQMQIQHEQLQQQQREMQHEQHNPQ